MKRLTRRSVVKAIALGAICAIPQDIALGVAGNTAPFKFGYSLYGMRQLSIDEALKHCARIGYQAVELPVMPGWSGEPGKLIRDDRAKLRQQLADRGIELTALMENLPLDGEENTHRAQLDRLKAACALARELNPDHPPIIETILGGKVGQWMELRDKFVSRVGDWNEIARQAETVICIKAHRMGAMNQPDQARWLVDQIGSPWLKLVYDYSHFQHRDMSIADTVRQMFPHVRFVHVKDTIVENDKARFVLPGEGGVDYVELFSQLTMANFSGCVCVEVSGMVQNQPGYDPIASAERSYANLARRL
jgi:sugar phosphate isomerase/epimerase